MSTIITNINQLDPKGSYTYADYLLWQFSERVELIKGKILKMSPAPSRNHQEISWIIARQLDKIFRKTSCKMYTAPFDVRLVDFKNSIDDSQIVSVVQPDLCVICDHNKLDEKGCIGAPDLIIEILSPGNSTKEMDLKFDLYQENKVKEYWIVNPMEKMILIYVLENERFVGLKPITEKSLLQSVVFPKLKFKAKVVFDL
ncbi:Uma2 family endonuclease [Flavobacterium sp.]|uniref:Uma2 family endonuclease n=1 Tax=Flavobacterium sp. TaxID=239 RepID=UPI00260655CC|nr:Uma2 family endonuclease [Flavobacterium sp.]